MNAVASMSGTIRSHNRVLESQCGDEYPPISRSALEQQERLALAALIRGSPSRISPQFDEATWVMCISGAKTTIARFPRSHSNDSMNTRQQQRLQLKW